MLADFETHEIVIDGVSDAPVHTTVGQPITNRDNLTLALGKLKEICPILHHLGTSFKVQGVIVNSAYSIARSMGKL